MWSPSGSVDEHAAIERQARPRLNQPRQDKPESQNQRDTVMSAAEATRALAAKVKAMRLPAISR